MKVLITGGAGFIGSHLAKFYRKRAEVRILDNLRNGDQRILEEDEVDFIQASLLDRAALRAAVSGVDFLFHLAAMVGVQESMEKPEECVQTNVIGTLNVLRAAAEAGVSKLVFASSAAVYGDSPPVPTPERAIPKPISPYGITKLDGEFYCELFEREGWLKTAALRFFNVFGPGQNPLNPYAAVVPTFLRRALLGDPLQIYGDGEQSRDFVYVKDVVSGLAFAAENAEVTGVFNCGSGRETTLNEFVRKLLAAANSQSPLEHLPRRAGDVRRSCASTEKLRALGWQPMTTLEQGLDETLSQFKMD